MRDNRRGIADVTAGDFLERAAWPVQAKACIYVCRPPALVGAATSGPGRQRPAPDVIKAERLGTAGGLT